MSALREYGEYCRNQDLGWLNQAKEQLAMFNELYLQYFNHEELREKISGVIDLLEDEIGVLNGRLKQKDNTAQQAICWHMG